MSHSRFRSRRLPIDSISPACHLYMTACLPSILDGIWNEKTSRVFSCVMATQDLFDLVECTEDSSDCEPTVALPAFAIRSVFLPLLNCFMPVMVILMVMCLAQCLRGNWILLYDTPLLVYEGIKRCEHVHWFFYVVRWAVAAVWLTWVERCSQSYF